MSFLSFDHKMSSKSRFNLLQLDFGEEYIDDIASFHCPAMPSQWYPLPRVSSTRFILFCFANSIN